MKMSDTLPIAKTAILALAEIKAAAEAFDRGDANLFEALDTIVAAVEAYQAAANDEAKRHQRQRRAA